VHHVEGGRDLNVAAASVRNNDPVERADAMRTVVELARRGSDASVLMTTAIGLCRNISAAAVWEQIAAIDWDADREHCRRWILALLDVETPGPSITGLWFGIFNPVRDGHIGSDFYVMGSSSYPSDDWMLESAWTPARRYAHSPAQAEIYRLAAQGGADALAVADYILTFAHAASRVNDFVGHLDRALMLGGAAARGVAVGHDSGDAVFLGELTSTGMDRSRAAENAEAAAPPHAPKVVTTKPGDFFYIHWADRPNLAVASAPDDLEQDRRLRAGGPVTDWKAVRFELGPGELADYLANSFAWRLCSTKLRDLLDKSRAAIDGIQWLPTTVTLPDGTELPFWVLHLPNAADVIDKSKSVIAGPVLVKAHLDRRLVDGHRLFGFPNDSVRVIVADDIRRRIMAAACTGMTFSRVPAT
jgi:hypothetical protein